MITYIWHVWHILLNRSEHAHIIMLVAYVLLILHKIGTCCCSKLHL